MLRALFLATTLVVLSAEHAFANAAPDLSTNAALKYWQAFAMLPRFTDVEQKKIGAECLTMPLDAHAREIVNKAAYALRMMRDGAALPRCDWGIGWEEVGIEVHLTHNAGARVLASYACLRARLSFKAGEHAEAIKDIVAGMTLARHISADSVLVMVLAGYAIEHRMIEALAPHLSALNAGMIGELKKRLAALPRGGRPATALPLERKWALDWFERKVKETKDKENLLALVSQCHGTKAKGRAFLAACGGTAEGVLKRAEETRPWYARTAKMLDLPLDRFAKEWEREERKWGSNPVFEVFFPAVEKVRLMQARTDIRRALLSAALAVKLDGPRALKDHPDPVVGGPFRYVAFTGGFELRSKFEPDDKLIAKLKLDKRAVQPVTLTAGRRP